MSAVWVIKYTLDAVNIHIVHAAFNATNRDENSQTEVVSKLVNYQISNSYLSITLRA